MNLQILVFICITFATSILGILTHRLQASLYCLRYQLGRKRLSYSPHTLCSHVKCKKEQTESNL